MDALREDRIYQLQQAIADLPADRWIQFLQGECGEDTALRDEVLRRQAALSSSQADTTSWNAFGVGSSGSVTDEPNPKRHAVDPAEFHGSDRHVLRRRLGSGGFGVVYEAHDVVKDTVVALKTLQHLTSDSLYRFKREFRSLVDVSHPNLVQLYELTSHENHWFFTMELVDGCQFLEYVTERPGDASRSTAHDEMRTSPAVVERLVPALRQLTDGLAALHRSSHVHRDVKPSNVLVESDGRVVLLDFGLVIDVERDAGLQSLLIAGTPEYMSPEQGAGLPLTPASDWYSVGVMLYEALTGHVPFSGNYLRVLTAKQQLDPPSPSSLVEGVPAHLASLCHDLLNRDPSRRPAAAEILNRLGSMDSSITEVPRPSKVSTETTPFIGRERQLSTLNAAFEKMLAGTPVLAAITGPSGIGKSALGRAFLDGLRQTAPDTVVLTGRCYERESVPYKALDSLVDSLARYLKRLPLHEARAVLPRDIDSLAQIFPVMGDFQTSYGRRLAVPRDVQELRRRACAALRELIARLGDAHSLVLAIDDLQWGDTDSATLLAEVIRPPDAPVLLVLASYRDVEIRTSPFLRTFWNHDAAAHLSIVPIRLEPLSADESEVLAATLTSTLSWSPNLSSIIATESGGSPFFISELVRFAEMTGGASGEASAPGPTDDSAEREATLAHMVQIRIARLPGVSQRLLKMVAVNGRPIPERILRFAAGPVGSESALALLRSEHLLRTRETDHGVEFEAYHDRIREIVVAGLDAAVLRECHMHLATAWEREGVADAEVLAEHFLGAGDTARAAAYMSVAAAEADRKLAFDRAARIYQSALQLLPPTSDQQGPLMARFALALTNAGRSTEAAAAYLAVPPATTAEALDFKQKAAQQLLFAAHLDEGLRVIREVLREIGMNLPETRRAALLALVVSRLRLRLRGLRYREREAHAIAPNELMKADACWSVSAGLGVIDTMRGAVFQARHLLAALRAGERERVHRALCLEAGFTAVAGPRTARRVTRILAMTESLARRIGSPYAQALHLLAEGVSNYLVGQWKLAATALHEAERLLTTHCTGVAWELDSSRIFGLWCLFHLGEIKTMATRFPILLKDAYDRGDLYAVTTIGGLFAHVVYLAAADSKGAYECMRSSIDRWPKADAFHLPQVADLWSSADIAMYERRSIDAWRLVDQTWPALKQSLLMEVQVTRVSMLDLRGRAALAAAHESRSADQRQGFLRAALKSAYALDRQRVPWASVLASMIRADVHEMRAEDGLAASLFDQVHRKCLTLDMHLLAAVARRRHGQLVGGDTGAAEIAGSDRWMEGQEIRNPAAFAQILAPFRP